MKLRIPQFFDSWIVLILLLSHLSISWAIRARFLPPNVDGSVWGRPGQFMFSGCAYAFAFFAIKKRSMTKYEVAKFAFESLILIMVWIIWLAPRIWDYTHAVEFKKYLEISVIYWFAFMFYFVMGVGATKSREGIIKSRERIQYDDDN